MSADPPFLSESRFQIAGCFKVPARNAATLSPLPTSFSNPISISIQEVLLPPVASTYSPVLTQNFYGRRQSGLDHRVSHRFDVTSEGLVDFNSTATARSSGCSSLLELI